MILQHNLNQRIRLTLLYGDLAKMGRYIEAKTGYKYGAFLNFLEGVSDSLSIAVALCELYGIKMEQLLDQDLILYRPADFRQKMASVCPAAEIAEDFGIEFKKAQ